MTNDIPSKEFVFGTIFLLANKIQADSDNVLVEISLKQWFLLMMITKMDKDTPSITEIADFIGSTRQNVRKLVSSLESKGFVSIVVKSDDKRSLEVSLTPLAYDFFSRFETKGDNYLKKLFDGISQDSLDVTKETFIAILNNISKNGGEKFEK